MAGSACVRSQSNNAANAYVFGLLLGLAEAQCTSPVFSKQDGAWKYAHAGLREAQTLMSTSSLSKLNFNKALMADALTNTNSFLRSRKDAYDKVVRLRKACGDTVRVSDY